MMIWVLLCGAVLPVHGRVEGKDSLGKTGIIEGTVTDGSAQDLMPFVRVCIRNAGFETQTDMNGWFEIRGVPPGVYAVDFSWMGEKVSLENVKVRKGKVCSLKAVMNAEPVAEKASHERDCCEPDFVWERMEAVRDSHPDPEEAVNLKGIAQWVELYSYYYSGADGERKSSGPDTSYCALFDERGNVIREQGIRDRTCCGPTLYLDSDGPLSKVYDSAGRLTEEHYYYVTTDPDGSDDAGVTESENYYYKYDAAGNMIRSDFYSTNVKLSMDGSTFCVYNSRNQLAEEREYLSWKGKDSLVRTHRITRNAEGRVASEIWIEYLDTYVSTDSVLYQYDGEGRQKGEKHWGKESMTPSRELISKTCIRYKPGAVTTTVVTRGEEAGKVVSVVQDLPAGRVESESWYDKKGHLMVKGMELYDEGHLVLEEFTCSCPEGEVAHFTYQYEFAPEGYWVKRTILRNGQPDCVLERKLIPVQK